MKITDSNVSMASSHDFRSHSYSESMQMEVRSSKDVPAAILSISAESSEKSYVESMRSYQQEEKKAVIDRQKQNEKRSMESMMEAIKNRNNRPYSISEKYDMQIKMLKKMLELLNGGKALSKYDEKMMRDAEGFLDVRSSSFKLSIGASASVTASTASRGGSIANGTSSAGTMWQRITVKSGFENEFENTTFASKGKVNTEDGRSIDFNVEFSMSRATMKELNLMSIENYQVFVTDPLVINLDSNVTSVSDQKFSFDLDADGKEDNISFAGKGSGFLALDKNGDGRINDGTELFGVKSNDGFKDLSEYDKDNNGWIDENDDVFSKLKVWMRDDEGNDILLNLKDADVGAIYLGNADTQYTLENEAGQTDGFIRKTGVFLHESTGMAGTVNHVDLAL